LNLENQVRLKKIFSKGCWHNRVTLTCANVCAAKFLAVSEKCCFVYTSIKRASMPKAGLWELGLQQKRLVF
jgi:hypothetical protein